MRYLCRILALVLAALSLPAQLPSTVEALDKLHKGEWWLSHIVGDLLPWWNMQTALGTPIGKYPTTRCDDGTLYIVSRPCPEIRNNSWINPRNNYIVGISRQVYAYGVIFHVTGDPTWLDYMRAGVNEIRTNWIDREHGGMATEWAAATNTYGPKPEWRDPQQLGYSLLGMSFYYYLTRDPEVLPDILAIKDFIFTRYYNPKLGAMQWLLEPQDATSAESLQLVAQLDQMNTYLVLLAPLLPEPHQSGWLNTLRSLCYIMMGKFYNPQQNLFFLSANKPEDLDPRYTGVDFGHTAKALWMIRNTGLLTGDTDLIAFAETSARRHLDRAFLANNGSWAGGLLQGGVTDLDKSWWVYCELDQLAGTLALTDPSTARYLPQTHDYWLTYFVDHSTGEVWNGVDGKTNQPLKSLPKQWQWKNGYHSLEHALVSYIVCQQLKGEPVTLYYGFDHLPPDNLVRPYYYTGRIDASSARPDDRGGSVWQVVFRDVH